MHERRWRIGELASATGLTVRTLHHYEQIGLLDAPSRSEGHQRLYDGHAVKRVQRILALRDLGLPLAEIAQLLDDEHATIAGSLRAQLARVDAHLERLKQVRGLLARACEQAERLADPHTTLDVIEATAQVMRRVAERGEDPGAPGETEAHWRALGDALRACMDAGEAAAAPRVRAIVRSIRGRLLEFAGGERATLDALAVLRRADPPQSLAGWDPELMRYLDLALAEREDDAC
jgi:DNA-binding transcriptional MerR regulator